MGKRVTKAEILKRKRIKEQERRTVIKLDPFKNEEQKQKDRERYLKRKHEGKIKLIKDLTPLQQKQKRLKWKVNNINSRYKKRNKLKNQPKTENEASCSTKEEPVTHIEDLLVKEEPTDDFSKYFDGESSFSEDPLNDKEAPISTTDLQQLPTTSVFNLKPLPPPIIPASSTIQTLTYDKDPLNDKELPISTTDLQKLPTTSVFHLKPLPLPIIPASSTIQNRTIKKSTVKSPILLKALKPDEVKLLKQKLSTFSKSTKSTLENQPPQTLQNPTSSIPDNPFHIISTNFLKTEINPQDNEEEVSDNVHNEDTKEDLLDISDTHLTINVEYPPIKECDLFGDYISKHLRKLPVTVARQLQADIQALVLKTRLEHVRENHMETPSIVREESRISESLVDKKPPCTTTTISDFKPIIPTYSRTIGMESNTLETNIPASSKTHPSSVKRRKSITTQANAKPRLQSTITKNYRNQYERTDYVVFAEYISAQLETLPEEISLKLQSEFYELLRKSFNGFQYNRVKIKTQSIDEISSGIDMQIN